MTHRELLARMSVAEIKEWMALYQIEADEREQSQQRARAEANADRGRQRIR